MDEILTAPLFYLMPAPFAVLVGIFAGRGGIRWWLAAGAAALAAWFHATMRFDDSNLALISAVIGVIWTVITIALYSVLHPRSNDKVAAPSPPVVFPKRIRPAAAPKDRILDGNEPPPNSGGPQL